MAHVWTSIPYHSSLRREAEGEVKSREYSSYFLPAWRTGDEGIWGKQPFGQPGCGKSLSVSRFAVCGRVVIVASSRMRPQPSDLWLHRTPKAFECRRSLFLFDACLSPYLPGR